MLGCMGARVYHVTFTKTFEACVVADSLDDLKKALNAENPDNGRWSTPEWEYDYRDVCDIRPLPHGLPTFDAAVVRKNGKLLVVSAGDDGASELRQRAEDELSRLHLEQKQLSLFPPK